MKIVTWKLDQQGSVWYFLQVIEIQLWLANVGERYNTVNILQNIRNTPPIARTLIARFMGPTWGPSGADRTQVDPMNFAIWVHLRVMYGRALRVHVLRVQNIICVLP